MKNTAPAGRDLDRHLAAVVEAVGLGGVIELVGAAVVAGGIEVSGSRRPGKHPLAAVVDRGVVDGDPHSHQRAVAGGDVPLVLVPGLPGQAGRPDFSRAFRRTYGCSPRAFRGDMAGGGAPPPIRLVRVRDVTVGFESIAGAAIAHRIVPAVPSWLAALVFMLALIAVNLSHVRSFGEFEYWFSLIKVVAIVAFIALGVAALAGLVPGFSSPGLSNLTHRGGFVPHGGGAVLLATLAVFFSYFGTEVVTIAAGEAADPAQAVRRGRNSVVWRLNSGIYSFSRMLYALARRGEAPPAFAITTAGGVPLWSVLAASSAGFATVVANYFLPTEAVFDFLLDSSSAVAVVVYLTITATHLRGRARLARGAAGHHVLHLGFGEAGAHSRRLHAEVSRAAHAIYLEAGARCRVPGAGFYLYPDFARPGVDAAAQ